MPYFAMTEIEGSGQKEYDSGHRKLQIFEKGGGYNDYHDFDAGSVLWNPSTRTLTGMGNDEAALRTGVILVLPVSVRIGSFVRSFQSCLAADPDHRTALWRTFYKDCVME